MIKLAPTRSSTRNASALTMRIACGTRCYTNLCLATLFVSFSKDRNPKSLSAKHVRYHAILQRQPRPCNTLPQPPQPPRPRPKHRERLVSRCQDTEDAKGGRQAGVADAMPNTRLHRRRFYSLQTLPTLARPSSGLLRDEAPKFLMLSRGI